MAMCATRNEKFVISVSIHRKGIPSTDARARMTREETLRVWVRTTTARVMEVVLLR